MENRRLELKVGAFMLLALGLGASLLFAFTGARGGSSGTLLIDYAYVGGLPEGALVKMAGVKVGRVTSVTLRPEATDASGHPLPVRVSADIDRAVLSAVRVDSTASIAPQGALGETYVELMPGRGRALGPGEALRGIDSPRLDLLFARVSRFFEDTETDDALRNFLVEVGNFVGLLNGAVGENRSEVAGGLRNVLAMLDDGRATVSDARTAMRDMKRVVRSADALLSSPQTRALLDDLSATAHLARTELPGVLAETKALVTHLEQTSGALTAEDVTRLKATLAKYDALAETLNKVSSNADQLLAGIQRGEGTAGMVVKDPKVYQELRDLLDDLKRHPWKLVWKK